MGKPGGGGSDPSDSKHDQKLQAVLLADSFTRTFAPVSLDRSTPKVLCPLNNVALLDYAIEFLAGAGVEELFVFCVSGADAVEEYVRDTSWKSAIEVRCVKDETCTNAGDALRELDKRGLVRSDPFVLMHGDVVTNADVKGALAAHKARKKKDNAAIMTMLFKRVGGWDVEDGDNSPETVGGTHAGGAAAPGAAAVRCSPLRPVHDDLVVGLDPTDANGTRVLLYDDTPRRPSLAVPTSFFAAHSRIDLRSDLLDCGVDICSPDVLARFSDEFDYRDVRRQFVTNSCAEEEEGLQNRIYAHMLDEGEYAARVHDFRTYHAVSRDLLRRWCYPVVPDNLPSGYEKMYRYALGRRFVYREVKGGGSRIGRSTDVKGPAMVGSRCRIGEGCKIEGTVIGNDCLIDADATVVNSHLWRNIHIEEGATVDRAILCDDVVVRCGATVSRGCVLGRGCVIGEGVILPEFTRVTLCKDDDEGSDGGFGDFDESSSSEEESSSGEEEESDNSEEESEGKAPAAGEGTGPTAPITSVASAGGTTTDHDIVGKDGLGHVWTPQSQEDDSDFESDSDDDDSDSASSGDGPKIDPNLELMHCQSVGYDPADVYAKRKVLQDRYVEKEDDFSDFDDHGEGGAGAFGDGGDGGSDDDEYGDAGVSFGDSDDDGTGGGGARQPSSVFGSIIGRQKDVDVVEELKQICLEHETNSPIDNLAIELNSYKFSQNATYSDCAQGATLAVLERLDVTADMAPAKLVSALRAELAHWTPLFTDKLCRGLDEERAVIAAVEGAAVGGGDLGDVLSGQPVFRFVLQTLHDAEIVNEEAILSWAEKKRGGGDLDTPAGKLFMQGPTQDFLEWLQEESESESGSDDDSDSD